MAGRLADRRQRPRAARSAIDLFGDALDGVVGGKVGAFLPAYEVGEVVAGEVGSAGAARSLLRMTGIRRAPG